MELWPKYFVILLGETVLLDTLIANSLTFALEVECYSSVQKNASILSLCYGIFWECHRSWSSRVCGWRRGRLCHLCSLAGHLWVDGYLIVNGKSIETFHGLVQKYIEESIDSFPPYISSYNSFPHLTSGDVVWIHSEQTDQLENTRIVVQKSAADMREAFKLNR